MSYQSVLTAVAYQTAVHRLACWSSRVDNGDTQWDIGSLTCFGSDGAVMEDAMGSSAAMDRTFYDWYELAKTGVGTLLAPRKAIT